MTHQLPSPATGALHRLLPVLPDLWKELETLVLQIPSGRVASCGALALGLGDIASALWIAQALLTPEWFSAAPRHRIVLRDGSPGKWSSDDPEAWSQQLQAEGIETAAGRVDLNRYGHNEFTGPRSLRRLRQLQDELARQAVIETQTRKPRTVAGVDVAYGKVRARPQAYGVASYVEIDLTTRRIVSQTTVTGRVLFPYIKGYLAFREVPLLCQLLSEVNQTRPLADVVFVDGNGWLHPRHAGLATHLGVLANVPTVGVGKKLLCGRIDQTSPQSASARPVLHEGMVVANAISNGPGNRPVYVSAGHQIDLAEATQLALDLCAGRRLPEPVALAHSDATRAAAYCR